MGMVNVWRVVRFAARAAAWRTTSDPPLVGLPVLLGFAVVVAAVRIGLQLLAAGSWHAFNPYGLNAVVAWIAIELAVAALFVRPPSRATALSALFILSIVADIATTAIKLGVPFLLPLLAPAAAQNAFWTGAIPADGIYAVAVVWWVGAMACVVGSLEPQRRPLLIGRVAALWVALFVANALVPHAPVFLPPHFDLRSANWWEVLYALHHEAGGAAEAAQVDKAQPSLLRAQLAHLAPSRPGVTGVYVLGIAGWAGQDVFIKELDGGLAAIASVLPTKDHIVRLINNRETLETVPLADPENFKAAVHGIARIMDKDADVFILLMTSHGDEPAFCCNCPAARSN